jgi:hypothetical protein
MHFTKEQYDLYIRNTRDTIILQMSAHRFDLVKSDFDKIEFLFNPQGRSDGPEHEAAKKALTEIVAPFLSLLSTATSATTAPSTAESSPEEEQTQDASPPPPNFAQAASASDVLAMLKPKPPKHPAEQFLDQADNYHKEFRGAIKSLLFGDNADFSTSALLASKDDALSEMKKSAARALAANSDELSAGRADYFQGLSALWTNDMDATITHFTSALKKSVVIIPSVKSELDLYFTMLEQHKSQPELGLIQTPEDSTLHRLQEFRQSVDNALPDNKQLVAQIELQPVHPELTSKLQGIKKYIEAVVPDPTPVTTTESQTTESPTTPEEPPLP